MRFTDKVMLKASSPLAPDKWRVAVAARDSLWRQACNFCSSSSSSKTTSRDGYDQRSTGSDHGLRCSRSRRRWTRPLTSSRARALVAVICTRCSLAWIRPRHGPARPLSAAVYSVSSAVIVDCYSGELPDCLHPAWLHWKIKIECMLCKCSSR